MLWAGLYLFLKCILVHVYIFFYIFFFVFQYELCKPPEVGREVDEDFLQQLDVVAGCELPQALKF
jgi:hypothetical protein